MTKTIVFIGSEIGVSDKKVKDLGAIKQNGARFHSASMHDFSVFIVCIMGLKSSPLGETFRLTPFTSEGCG